MSCSKFFPTFLSKSSLGVGKVNELPKFVKGLGKKALMVTGRRSTKASGILDRVIQLFSYAGIESVVFDKVISNPILETVDKEAEVARKEGIDLIVGLDGGNAIDSAKAML